MWNLILFVALIWVLLNMFKSGLSLIKFVILLGIILMFLR